MDINKDDELIVSRFFDEHKFDIADNGFSERVMEKLPSWSAKVNRIWTLVCCVVAFVWIVYIVRGVDTAQVVNSVEADVASMLKNAFGTFTTIVTSVKQYMSTIIITTVAVVALSIMFALERYSIK